VQYRGPVEMTNMELEELMVASVCVGIRSLTGHGSTTTKSIIKLQVIQRLMSVVEKAENEATLCQSVLQATSLSLRSQTTRPLCILISSLGLQNARVSVNLE